MLGNTEETTDFGTGAPLRFHRAAERGDKGVGLVKH